MESRTRFTSSYACSTWRLVRRGEGVTKVLRIDAARRGLNSPARRNGSDAAGSRRRSDESERRRAPPVRARALRNAAAVVPRIAAHSAPPARRWRQGRRRCAGWGPAPAASPACTRRRPLPPGSFCSATRSAALSISFGAWPRSSASVSKVQDVRFFAQQVPDRHPVRPGRDRALAPARQLRDDQDQDLLGSVARGLWCAEHSQRQPVRLPLEAANQRLERIAIALLASGERIERRVHGFLVRAAIRDGRRDLGGRVLDVVQAGHGHLSLVQPAPTLIAAAGDTRSALTNSFGIDDCARKPT